MELNLTKEAIKSRILKNAAHFWGISNVDLIDPVVRLLLEAVANEVFKLQHDIRDTQTRILEDLANLLTPVAFSAARPAHGVLHTIASEPVASITSDRHYECQIANPHQVAENITISFTPIGSVQIFDADVVHMLTAASLYTIEHHLTKQVLDLPIANSIPVHELWLGLTCAPFLHTLKDLSFFVDWPGIDHKSDLYLMVQLAKWSINGEQALPMQSGINYQEQPEGGLLHLVEQFSPHYLVLEEIKAYYQSKFFTVCAEVPNLQECLISYPKAFQRYFTVEQLKEHFKQKMLWIKITFPEYSTLELLDSLLISINSFPVVNRQLKNNQGSMGIIPLPTKDYEQVLSVHSVMGIHTGMYYPAPVLEELAEEQTYSLKGAGVERFDARDAREYLDRLKELLRDEAIAFTRFHVHEQEILSMIDKLVQRLDLAVRELGQDSKKNLATNYVMINQKGSMKEENVWVEYWVTNCAYANNLRVGLQLMDVTGSPAGAASVRMLTPTIGGQSTPVADNRLHAYQYALLTHGQIVSKQDIKNFFYYELGNKLNKCLVSNGVMVSPDPREGLVRTIDVFLTATDRNLFKDTDSNKLTEQLLHKIRHCSDPGWRYRIFWEERPGER